MRGVVFTIASMVQLAAAASAQTYAPVPPPPGSGPPTADSFAYPSLPEVPKLAAASYPSCQNGWQTAASRIARYTAIQSCINELERYNLFYLKRFPVDVSRYSTKIILIEQQFARSSAPLANKQVFHDQVLERIARVRSRKNMDDQDYGDDYRDYYVYLQHYQDDTRVLTAAREPCRDAGGSC